MNGPRLLIRADANSDIGYGHVMRCLALAQRWSRIAEGRVRFVCHQPSPLIALRIRNEGFELEESVSLPGSSAGAAELVRIARVFNADSMVLDGYAFDSEFQEQVSAESPLLVIDDYGHLKSYHTHFLLNQNAGVHAQLYAARTDSTTELLVGPGFALLRDEFLQQQPARISSWTKQKTVLITLGGSDPDNLTQRIIDGAELTTDPNVKFILLSPVKGLRISDSRIDLVPFSDNMAELYCQSDFAICAGGSTNWELSYYGVPRLVVVLADNQSGIAESLHDLGCVRSLGWHDALTAEKIALALTELINDDVQAMRENNRSLIDGRGSERVVQHLLSALPAAPERKQKTPRKDMDVFQINGRQIGHDQPAYIIAEMSANHHQNLQTAREIVHAMHESGADAVKLQTYTPDTLTIDSDKPLFRVGAGTIWEGRRLHELYGEACTPWEWHAELFELATSLGLDCFSTPFDFSAVDFLEQLDPPAYKIASFELVDIPLIEYVASKGRPVIMSTGMGNLDEIRDAVNAVRQFGVPLSLLKCTSAYPSPPESMNLRTIADLKRRFGENGTAIGLSDHTLGTEVAIAAVAMGAKVIEKHFTLSRSVPGPDSAFSLEPSEFRQMVDAVRSTEAAMGTVNYERTEKEEASIVFRRSLFVVQDIKAGELFSPENVRSIRPGHGLPPKHLPAIIGQKALQDIERGTPLSWDHVPLTIKRAG